MRFIFSFLIFCLAGTILSDAGMLSGTPARIISLSPNATATLVELGIQGELVGTTRYCTPPAGTQPTVIGGFIDPSPETILALRPDLLIRAYTQDQSFLKRMERRGVHHLLLNPESYENTKRDVALLGKIIGKEKRAGEILANWAEIEARIKKELQAHPLKKTPRVLIRWGDVFVGKKSYLHEAILLCGGTNAVPETSRAWPILPKEAIIATRADLLICVLSDGENALTHVPALAKELAKDPTYATLPAVRAGNVWAICENSGLLYPSSRLRFALPALAEAIRAHSCPQNVL